MRYYSPKILISLALVLTACGAPSFLSRNFYNSETSPQAPTPLPHFYAKGLQFSSTDGKVRLDTQPGVQINGTWMEALHESDCTLNEEHKLCSLGDLGTLDLHLEGKKVRVSFMAHKDSTVEAIGLRGSLQLPGAGAWLSNGLQSWSQTGVISLSSAPTSRDFNKALRAQGEDEVYRRGTELSWWYSFIGGAEQNFLAGVSTANRLRSYVQFHKRTEPDLIQANFISGGTEQIHLQPGETLVGESWYLDLGPQLQTQLDGYADSLSSRRKQHPIKALTGWNSWYDLWDDVKEDDVLANSALLREVWQSRLPSSAGPITVTLDDGWEEKWGDWTPNSKFPSGIAGLAREVEKDGFQLGLWLAPLLADPESQIAQLHPEWMVKNASYRAPSGIQFRILDITQAAVAEHLQANIRRLVSSGAKVLKIDFLFAGIFEGSRSQKITGMEAYHLAMRLIREAAGESTILLAVGAPPLATLEYVDAWRVGNDIAFKPFLFGIPRPGPSFIANQARSLAGRYPFCRISLCDADPALLRSLDKEEVETGAWISAATGGALILSDNLVSLPKERRTWGYDAEKIALGLSGQTARLENYFPSEIPMDLKNMKDDFFNAEQNVPDIWL
ncbi:MAG: alpha-galactosidase, partial [Proteobacteria bacterium]|nr:alpha-galactosidase [Pseudomonadota bacterium]